ncbi:TPM domain-containing protein [Sphingobacterium lumbrici]|uniref:TPM domain-containing protein n=1 Tax=Sphingobacterium lumbrici TaxID=2559600 RepID=UPI00112728B8|nr:TPM domain-containing protein [Sphingobacterium lumbrici]
MAVLSAEEQEKVVHAISLAENKTSGEIRIVVENTVGDVEPITKAQQYFEELEMHKTILRNGVLIYLAVADHQFAIIGDAGIDQNVQDEFWESTKDKMVSFFRKGDYVNGLIEGIHEVGEQLKQFFPRKEDDINELPNDIYFGKH